MEKEKLKGFPHRTNFWKFPIGWEDKGYVEGGELVLINGVEYRHKKMCDKCHSILKVGIENNKAFLFCGKCLEKK